MISVNRRRDVTLFQKTNHPQNSLRVNYQVQGLLNAVYQTRSLTGFLAEFRWRQMNPIGISEWRKINDRTSHQQESHVEQTNVLSDGLFC